MSDENEKWSDVIGYEGLYQVSTFGRVKSEWRSKKILRPCNTRGYRWVSLRKNGTKRAALVHRLVAESFLGPSNLQVNHKDLNRSNNCLYNLEYTTAKGNTQHALEARGVWHNIGDKHHNTEVKFNMLVNALYLIHTSKMSKTEIAKKLGISLNVMYLLKRRREYAKAMLVVHKLLTPSQSLLD